MPNFFNSADSVERVFLTDDKQFWVDCKTALTMEDMTSVKSVAQTDPDGTPNPYTSVLVMMTACIKAWNLPDPTDATRIMPVTPETIRSLSVAVFAKLTPIIKKIQEGSFLVERSQQLSTPQSSSEEQSQTM